MYKLVLLILALSGFLIFKAVSIKVKAKSAAASAYSRLQPSKPNKQLAPPQLSKASQAHSNTENEPLPATNTPGATSQREQFDSLADVYTGGGGIPADKLTQDERETYENTLNQINKVEADDAARKNLRPGKTKSPDELTSDEEKLFEDYRTKENAND